MIIGYQDKLCNKCNQIKSHAIVGYYLKGNPKLYQKFHSSCKDCLCIRNAAYQKECAQKAKEIAVKLLGWKCAKCEIKDTCFDIYDFHHKYKENKEYNISNKIAHLWNPEQIKKELLDCELLCAVCHRRHHYQERMHENTIRMKPFLTVFTGNNRNVKLNPLRLCLVCQKIELHKERNVCIKCYYKYEGIRHSEVMQKVKRKCLDYLGGACNHCSLTDECTAIYDFHHRNPDEKEIAISALLLKRRTFTIELQQELDKCDILCAVCHRRHHSSIITPIINQVLLV